MSSDRRRSGADRLGREPAVGDPSSAFLAQAPLSEAARRDIGRLVKERPDYLPGLDDDAKKRRLARMSYADFLVKSAACHPDVLPFFQARPHSLYWGLGLPGFTGMKLDPTPGPGMGLDARPGPRSPFLHFPDGNATLARLLVQRLIPRAVPGRTVDDVVVA